MGELSVENPLLQTYIFYGAILMLKMMSLSLVTGFYRMSKNAFANPEDAARRPKGKVYEDADVERVRRAHRNDMENIYVFMIVGLLYILTDPCVFKATMCFRVFTVARILHSVVYIGAVRQPARGLCYLVGQIVNVYMALNVLIKFM